MFIFPFLLKFLTSFDLCVQDDDDADNEDDDDADDNDENENDMDIEFESIQHEQRQIEEISRKDWILNQIARGRKLRGNLTVDKALNLNKIWADEGDENDNDDDILQSQTGSNEMNPKQQEESDLEYARKLQAEFEEERKQQSQKQKDDTQNDAVIAQQLALQLNRPETDDDDDDDDDYDNDGDEEYDPNKDAFLQKEIQKHQQKMSGISPKKVGGGRIGSGGSGGSGGGGATSSSENETVLKMQQKRTKKKAELKGISPSQAAAKYHLMKNQAIDSISRNIMNKQILKAYAGSDKALLMVKANLSFSMFIIINSFHLFMFIIITMYVYNYKLISFTQCWANYILKMECLNYLHLLFVHGINQIKKGLEILVDNQLM